MVAKSVSGGGGRVSLGKAKQHFFKNLDLNCVITPADEHAGAFTGAFVASTCSTASGQMPAWHACSRS
jgi:hypothetical protein